MRAKSYRQYNQAYFEEVIITNHDKIEQRAVQNFRERFLTTHEDIYIVFLMYCKEDYHEHFMRTDKSDINHKEFVNLFMQCLKNDSLRTAVLIYNLYINPAVDFDDTVMNILLLRCRFPACLEMKLAFIHGHFDQLSIEQMNQLIETFAEITQVKDIKANPMIY